MTQHSTHTQDSGHGAEHAQKPHTESVNTPLVLTVGVVLFFAVVASVVLVYAFYINYTTENLADKERTTPGAPLLKTREEKAIALTTLDKGGEVKMASLQEGGPDRIAKILPREQAIGQVVGEYSQVKIGQVK